jgi:hypothetical protein
MTEKMKEIIDKLILFEKELDSNSLVVKEKFELINQPANPSLVTVQRELNRIEPTVLDFYELANGMEVKWKPVDPSLLESDIVGRTKISLFIQVVRDWGGVVFFDSDPADSPRRKFFPLDFFADEAAAGFCTMEGWRNMIYLYKFEGDLVPLYVNFESYLSLMVYARSCFYWQYLILEIVEGQENEVSARIKQYLPKLFKDFSFDAFQKLFNEVRIK